MVSEVVGVVAVTVAVVVVGITIVYYYYWSVTHSSTLCLVYSCLVLSYPYIYYKLIKLINNNNKQIDNQNNRYEQEKET